jgi:tripartite-type tricarboxylate transporter receptor subunit TctC
MLSNKSLLIVLTNRKLCPITSETIGKEKHMKRLIMLLAILVTITVLLTAGTTSAANWPEKGKIMTLYVPAGAGGGTDTGGRALMQFLGPELGVKVVVVNRAGAGSQIGITEFLAKSGIDGYTILTTSTPACHAPYLDPGRKATYTRKDLQLVANYSHTSSAIAVVKGRYKGLKDLIEDAKARPGKIRISASNPLSASDYSIIQLEKVAGIRVAHMFFDQQGEQRAALLGGHVDAEMNNAFELVPGQKSGEIDVLAVFDKKESSFLPGVKTAEAQGYKSYMYSGNSMVFKAGTPKEIVDTMAETIRKAATRPELQEIFRKISLELNILVGKEHEDYFNYTENIVREVLDDLKKKKTQ